MLTIDPNSGFCFGVVTAIRKAEEELQKGTTLYCLGDIVHNDEEVARLTALGLITIDHSEFQQLPSGSKVLIRAHGEPPETYNIARKRGIELIDASCPVVRNLQQKIRNAYEQNPQAQIVIFGKKGHAEVIGLQGQTANTAMVVENTNDIDKIDFTKDIYLFSQTTKSVDEFHKLILAIQSHLNQQEHHSNQQEHHPTFLSFDTICHQVRNRVKHIREFALAHDIIIFVGGRNSSNGKVLFEHCKAVNPNTIFIENDAELTEQYIASLQGKNIGICGATSTPLWLMENVKHKITH